MKSTKVDILKNLSNAPKKGLYKLKQGSNSDDYELLVKSKSKDKIYLLDQSELLNSGEGIESVTGDIVDNTNPLNPVVNISFENTIAELRALMASNGLKVGAKYKSTDFTTIYDQPDYDSSGNPKISVVTKTGVVEHLVFTANSDSTFDSYVSSVEYPTDKIKFDWTFTQTEYMNAPAKGRIVERIDDHFNRADYDFRNVLYLRYESSTGSGVFNSWKDNGEASQEFLTFDYAMSFHFVIKDSKITSSVLSLPFILPNIITTGDLSAGVTIGSNSRNITFMAGCTGSVIEDFVSNLTCNNAFNYNYIGGGSYDILFNGIVNQSWFNADIVGLTIDGFCDNNYIGTCANVHFLGYTQNNSIWDRIENCTFGNNFNQNIQYGILINSTIGSDFLDGVIYGYVDGLTIGNNNIKIEVKSGSNIIIGNSNRNIQFGGTTNITAGNDFNGIRNVSFGGSIDGAGWVNFITVANHPEMYVNATKTVILGSDGNVYSRYFNGATDAITLID